MSRGYMRNDTLVVKLEWTMERRVDACLGSVIVDLRVWKKIAKYSAGNWYTMLQTKRNAEDCLDDFRLGCIDGWVDGSIEGTAVGCIDGTKAFMMVALLEIH